MDLPSTLGAWAVLVLAVLSILTILLGATIKLARMHIDTRISKTLEFTVRKAIVDGLVPVNAKLDNTNQRLDAMQIQLVTQDGELARIRDIETKINNGITERLASTERKVDQLIEHQLWDGQNDRRTE
jgi:enoyl reductase-like protein